MHTIDVSSMIVFNELKAKIFLDIIVNIISENYKLKNKIHKSLVLPAVVETASIA